MSLFHRPIGFPFSSFSLLFILPIFPRFIKYSIFSSVVFVSFHIIPASSNLICCSSLNFPSLFASFIWFFHIPIGFPFSSFSFFLILPIFPRLIRHSIFSSSVFISFQTIPTSSNLFCCSSLNFPALYAIFICFFHLPIGFPFSSFSFDFILPIFPRLIKYSIFSSSVFSPSLSFQTIPASSNPLFCSSLSFSSLYACFMSLFHCPIGFPSSSFVFWLILPIFPRFIKYSIFSSSVFSPSLSFQTIPASSNLLCCSSLNFPFLCACFMSLFHCPIGFPFSSFSLFFILSIFPRLIRYSIFSSNVIRSSFNLPSFQTISASSNLLCCSSLNFPFLYSFFMSLFHCPIGFPFLSFSFAFILPIFPRFIKYSIFSSILYLLSYLSTSSFIVTKSLITPVTSKSITSKSLLAFWIILGGSSMSHKSISAPLFNISSISSFFSSSKSGNCSNPFVYFMYSFWIL